MHHHTTTTITTPALGVLVLLALCTPDVSARDPIPAAPAFHGEVIDADTKAPIPEAWVIGYVTVGLKGGWSMHGSGWRNLQRTAMPTDASGRFAIPPWTWSKNHPMDMRRYLAGFTAYAPGYVLALPDDAMVVMQPIEWAHTLGIVRTDDLKPSRPVRLYLRRVRGDDLHAQVRDLSLLLSRWRLDFDHDDSTGDAYFYAAVKTEIARLLTSPSLDSKTRQSLLDDVEDLRRSIEGNPAPEPPRQTQRVKRATPRGVASQPGPP